MTGERRADPDPFPNLGWLRENAPVSLTENDMDAAPIYFVASYDLVRSCLADNRLGADPRWSATADLATIPFERSVLDSDPPEHTRMRRTLRPVFGVATVRRLLPRIEEICRETIRTFAADGSADLMSQYAQVVPVDVIHELLGVPERMRVAPGALMDWFWHGGLSRHLDDDADEHIEDYLRRILAHKREHRGDDVTTILLDALDAGELRDEAELRGTLASILGPGHITTVPLLATGIVRMLERPAVLAAARAEPARWADVVEEVLRFDSVVQVSNNRYAHEDMEIGSVPVPKGSTVLLSLAAANRDPARFTDPDEFDIDRPRGGHMAFGHGPHVCAGAQLGRVEGERALAILFEELPDLRLDCRPEEIVWTWGPIERGPAEIPVTFTPRGSA
jgi:cytochrome P450